MTLRTVASKAANPKNTFAILQSLLDGHDQHGLVSYDLTRHAVPMVIANALRSDDEGLRVRAEAHMNKLGAEGYLTLKSEVDAVLEGSLTVDDLDD
jgi:hypothetical protein